MLSDRELRERLKTEPDAAAVHKLIADWEPLQVRRVTRHATEPTEDLRGTGTARPQQGPFVGEVTVRR